MKNNYRLESRMRENRPCGSEGGEGVSPFRPLSSFATAMPDQKFTTRLGAAAGAAVPAGRLNIPLGRLSR